MSVGKLLLAKASRKCLSSCRAASFDGHVQRSSSLPCPLNSSTARAGRVIPKFLLRDFIILQDLGYDL